MTPRLTIGIPTLGSRPDRLQKAIQTALGQAVPARVLVCDQARGDDVRDMVEPFRENPLFRHEKSPATCLWENWSHAVHVADTEFFAWLQDDDVLSPFFSQRIARAFDRHPHSIVWTARLGISHTEGAANWWQATGPMVPMDLLAGGTTEIYSQLVIVGSYFTSWALSPGVAFRRTTEALAAVHSCPRDADLYVERSILAELCKTGKHAICDPCIAGYWVMHDGNESRKQVIAGDVTRQFRVMAEEIDKILGRTMGWQDALKGWCTLLGPDMGQKFLTDTEGFDGEFSTLDEARSIIRAMGPQEQPEPSAPVEPVEHAVNGKHRRARKAVKQR